LKSGKVLANSTALLLVSSTIFSASLLLFLLEIC